MLTLTFREDEWCYIDGGRIAFQIVGIRCRDGRGVRIAFAVPDDVVVDREKIHHAKQFGKQQGDAP